MKKRIVSLVIFGFLMMLAPMSLLAQNDPPPCCPRGTGAAIQNQAGSLVAGGQLFVTTDMLQSHGITKREFVESLSMSMFAGKTVDLLLSVKSTTNQPKPVDMIGSSSLVAVEETRVYRVPLYSLEAEQLEAMDQFGLTDGVAQLTVKFVKSDSIKSQTD